jgi:hypothetical protein
VLPRQFPATPDVASILNSSLSESACEIGIDDREAWVLLVGQVAAIALYFAVSRRRSRTVGSPVDAAEEDSSPTFLDAHRVMVPVAAVALAGLVGVPLALVTRQHTKRVESARPVAAARPAAADTCTALTAWSTAIVEISQAGGAAIGATESLAEKRAAVVQIVDGVRNATADVRARFASVRSTYGTVRGVPELVGLIDRHFQDIEDRLDRLEREAEALPVDTPSHFEEGKRSVADGMSGAGGDFTIGDVGIDTAAAASVAATFVEQPECAGLF